MAMKYVPTQEGFVMDTTTGEILTDANGDNLDAKAIVMVHLITGKHIENIIDDLKA